MATSTLLTFEEFERLPERPGKQELLDGELIELPPAKLRHDRITLRIFKCLDSAVEHAKSSGLPNADLLGTVHIETGYRLGPHWLIPDVSISHANQPEGDYYLGAPALAVEVVSETNTAQHIEAKVARYLSSGAHEVWVVYPKTAHVWVHRQSSHEPCDSVVKSRLLGGIAVSDLLG